MSEIFECEVCGVVSKVSNDLCHPDLREDIHDYCGTTRERAAPCDNIKVSLPIVCENCGRPAEQADLVCKPLMLG